MHYKYAPKGLHFSFVVLVQRHSVQLNNINIIKKAQIIYKKENCYIYIVLCFLINNKHLSQTSVVNEKIIAVATK